MIKNIFKIIIFVTSSFFIIKCKIPNLNFKAESKKTPDYFNTKTDSSTIANWNWKIFYNDSNLQSLIDTALVNNQELNIILQEIEISKNEIKARKGEYLPFVTYLGSVGFEKPGKYTRDGATEDQLLIKDNQRFPEPLTDFLGSVNFSWEIDIWNKLHRAQKAAVMRYLATQEGKNFMITQLINEISETYYEILAQDIFLELVLKNIEIQNQALNIIKLQKNAAQVSQLAVNRFEAQLLNTKNIQFNINQKIIILENRLKYLTGKFNTPITRNSNSFWDINVDHISVGLPAQLLVNRPDIRQAEYQLMAAKLDVQVARANFLPSLRLKAGLGLQAFNPIYLINPSSLLYNALGDLMGPLINLNAIKANYNSASAKQIQTVYNYEKTILNGYVEVLNQLTKIENYTQSLNTKMNQVDILNNSINISLNLFNSAQADYNEVLLTQRETLEAKIDLIEIKANQIKAKINLYKALGGGWK